MKCEKIEKLSTTFYNIPQIYDCEEVTVEIEIIKKTLSNFHHQTIEGSICETPTVCRDSIFHSNKIFWSRSFYCDWTDIHRLEGIVDDSVRLNPQTLCGQF